MANLWVRKPLSQLLAQAADSEKGLKRTLGAWNLVALGIGAIIGAAFLYAPLQLLPKQPAPL